MMLYRVCDVEPSECFAQSYDAVFLASGYERRATSIARRLPKTADVPVAVLGFDTFRDDPGRRENDAYFRNQWGVEPVVISGNDESPVYGICRDMHLAGKSSVRLLVDYSSMSRLWYAGLLNWARSLSGVHDVVIDCLYACGRYTDDRPQMVIEEILAVPGCEGGAIRLAKSVAVFGLGFDHLATLCVLDRLEPDIAYAYLASPAADRAYPDRVKSLNGEMIRGHVRQTLDFPLGSVERTFGGLAELVAPHISEADVTLVPMGPKPHVLASMLLSLRFEEIACLRVSGRAEHPADVEPTGEMIATRVQFRAVTDRSGANVGKKPSSSAK